MKDGFFEVSDLKTSRKETPLVPRCGLCQLYKHCKSPKMPVFGEGRKEILICAECPGENEDNLNRPLIGLSGQRVKQGLLKAGIKMDRDCWLYNAVICRPSKDGRNRNPTSQEVAHCRPNLVNTIKKLKPKVIILLGEKAVESLIVDIWKDKPDSIGRWVGFTIPDRKYNAWICPNWHPSYTLRRKDVALDMLFDQYLENAVSKRKSRPWENAPPDPAEKVRMLFTEKEIINGIENIIQANKMTAWDLETNMLKPDSKEAEIYCCSLANEDGCISFPWLKSIEDTMRKFLKSDVPKVGFNIPFESRWILSKLRIKVRNWKWCGMLGTHVLDNRRKICGLKFQSFVNFGVPDYDSHVSPYLKSKGTNVPNKIKRVKLEDVLLYCGIDSVLELWLAQKQMEEMQCLVG